SVRAAWAAARVGAGAQWARDASDADERQRVEVRVWQLRSVWRGNPRPLADVRRCGVHVAGLSARAIQLWRTQPVGLVRRARADRTQLIESWKQAASTTRSCLSSSRATDRRTSCRR